MITLLLGFTVFFGIFGVWRWRVLNFNKKVRRENFQRELILIRGEERFIFRYHDGCEDELLDALMHQARDERTSFDYFDAAIVSFRLSQSFVDRAEGLMGDFE